MNHKHFKTVQQKILIHEVRPKYLGQNQPYHNIRNVVLDNIENMDQLLLSTKILQLIITIIANETQHPHCTVAQRSQPPKPY